MKNLWVHHIINLKSGTSDYYIDEIMTIKEAHEMTKDLSFFEWGLDYYESCLNGDRSMTQNEWKAFMHHERHQAWEQYKDELFEDMNFPTLNPGGGPYHIES